MSLPTNKERFESDLKELRKDFHGKMTNLEIDSVPLSIKWDRKDRRADDLGNLDKWGKTLIDKVSEEAQKIFESGNIKEAHEEEELMRITKRAMTKAVERFGTVLGSFQNGEIANKTQVDEFWQRAAVVLWSIDEKALMLESAKEEALPDPVVLAFYKSIESHIPSDYTAIVERILKDELKPEDREIIADKFLRLMGGDSLTKIYSESTKDIRTGEVTLLLLNLNKNTSEKRKVIEIITAKPGGPAAIMHLVVGDFISAAEGEQYIQRQLTYEQDPDRIEAFKQVKNFILGESMSKVQEMQANAKKEIRERANFIIGNKNQAAAKLSYSGLGSLYLKSIATGALGLMVMANWKQPGKLMRNPVTWAALATGSLAAEMDKSDIGIWPKPGTYLSKIAQDKNKMEEGALDSKFRAFDNDLLNNVSTAELYYNLIPEVRKATLDQLNKGIPLHEVEIKLDAIGIDYKKLDKRFRLRGKADIEDHFTKWTRSFFLEKGLNRPGENQQKNYMNELRRSRKIDGTWKTYNLSKALL